MKRPKVSVFVTNTKESEKSNTVMKPQGVIESSIRHANESKRVSMPFNSSSPVKCMYCSESHSIHKYQTFTNKTSEEKKRFILEKNLCFGCLKKGHNSKDCRNKATCSICKKHHPTPLHEYRHIDQGTAPRDVVQTEGTSSSLSCSVDKGDGGSTSMIVPVWLSSVTAPETETLVYALLDTQSSTTFVDKAVCEQMGSGLDPVKLKLTTLMGKDSIVQSDIVSGLRVRGFSSHSFVNLPPVYTRDFIPLERSHIPTAATARRWKHLNAIAQEVPELLDCEVGLLIGYDCSRALAPQQVITGGDEEPYAIRTDLGWSIVGSSPKVAKSTEVTGLCHRVFVKELPALTPAAVLKVLESNFRDTSYGEKSVSQDDIYFMQILNQTIHQNSDGHLEMPLPFKTRPHLPENKQLALVRLKHLQRKFERNPKFKEDYVRFMAGVIEGGEAERVEDMPQNGNVWYIPHQGVYHPRKPEKIRVVFDCSAKYEGTILNDHLLMT